MANLTTIVPPRVPFIDSVTGFVSREWYRFLLNLFQLTGSGQEASTLSEVKTLAIHRSFMLMGG